MALASCWAFLSFSVPTCKMGSMLRVNEWITYVKGWPRGGSFKRHFACFFFRSKCLLWALQLKQDEGWAGDSLWGNWGC